MRVGHLLCFWIKMKSGLQYLENHCGFRFLLFFRFLRNRLFKRLGKFSNTEGTHDVLRYQEIVVPVNSSTQSLLILTGVILNEVKDLIDSSLRSE